MIIATFQLLHTSWCKLANLSRISLFSPILVNSISLDWQRYSKKYPSRGITRCLLSQHPPTNLPGNILPSFSSFRRHSVQKKRTLWSLTVSFSVFSINIQGQSLSTELAMLLYWAADCAREHYHKKKAIQTSQAWILLCYESSSPMNSCIVQSAYWACFLELLFSSAVKFLTNGRSLSSFWPAHVKTLWSEIASHYYTRVLRYSVSESSVPGCKFTRSSSRREKGNLRDCNENAGTTTIYRHG